MQERWQQQEAEGPLFSVKQRKVGGQGEDPVWQVGSLWNGRGAEEKSGVGVLAVGPQQCPRHGLGSRCGPRERGELSWWWWGGGGAGGARAEKGASKAVAKWRTGQWLTRGRGNQVGCPDRGEGREQRVKLQRRA